MNKGNNFQAVTVVNGNISRRINVERGCRQGDPISGYLFILAIEISSLFLKKSKAKNYKSRIENGQLLDIHPDDLSIYLESNKSNKPLNEKNVQETSTVFEMFYEWSGLKVNRGKTQITIFGRTCSKPSFVDTLRIKWCSMFGLLGI